MMMGAIADMGSNCGRLDITGLGAGATATATGNARVSKVRVDTVKIT